MVGLVGRTAAKLVGMDGLLAQCRILPTALRDKDFEQVYAFFRCSFDLSFRLPNADATGPTFDGKQFYRSPRNDGEQN